MLATLEITELATRITNQIPLLNGINSEQEYTDALELMDSLFESYDVNLIIIEALGNVITRYEDKAESFDAFNSRQKDIDPSIATLRVLIDQNNLKTSDFENEIGKKSLVSLILAGKRNLTRNHILKLSYRFSVSPVLFF